MIENVRNFGAIEANGPPPRAFLEINEIAETSPNEAGYRQWAQTGSRLVVHTYHDGLLVNVNGGSIVLDRAQAAELRDWIRDLPF